MPHQSYPEINPNINAAQNNKLIIQVHPQNPAHLTHPKYRADIGGLRAIAILSIVGFHAFPDWVKGGFIGVDIFFVISGFLISTIIFDSLERNNFCFIEFYVRRINRIFPALLLVLITCFAVGWQDSGIVLKDEIVRFANLPLGEDAKQLES